MADDLKQTGKADDSRINIEQDHKVQYWAEKYGVSRERCGAQSRRQGYERIYSIGIRCRCSSGRGAQFRAPLPSIHVARAKEPQS